MNDNEKDLYLRLTLLITLIIFLIVLIVVPQDNCDNCKFKFPDGEKDTGEVLNEYFNKCIDPYTGEINRHQLDVPNISLINESIE